MKTETQWATHLKRTGDILLRESQEEAEEDLEEFGSASVEVLYRTITYSDWKSLSDPQPR